MRKFLIFIFVVANTSSYANDKDDIAAIVYQWNESHTTKTVHRLMRLYAPLVRYYGLKTSNEKCVLSKFNNVKYNFKQEIISDITIMYYDKGFIKADFIKKVTTKKGEKQYYAYLVLEKRAGNYLIVAESDQATDTNLGISLSYLGNPEKQGNKVFFYATLILGCIVIISVVIYRRKTHINQIKPFNSKSFEQPLKPGNAYQFENNNKKRNLKNGTGADPYKKIITTITEEIVVENDLSHYKGTEFEKYIADLFNPGYFTLTRWASDKISNKGAYAIETKYPDLEIKFIHAIGEYKFAVECKWRKQFINGEIKWARWSQINNYKTYQKEQKIPVFVAIGVGGNPGKPEMLFVPSLDDIAFSETLNQFQLKRFERHPEHYFFYNIFQKNLG